jgi:uncharacterized membrane protein YkvA (DUF1232 family)
MKRVHKSRWFKRAQFRAERISRDQRKTRKIVDAATKKASRHGSGPIARVIDDLMTLTRLVRAWVSREYREVPGASILLMIGTLVYFVSPFDAIPDVVPVLGLVDDATLVTWTVASLRSDIAAFRAWESQRTNGGA